jgi:hypothetical protein
MKIFGGRFKAHLFFRGMSYGLGGKFGDVKAAAMGNWSMSSTRSVSLGMERRMTDGDYATEIKTLWNVFF